MKAIYALEGGVAGAAALTLLHETIKKTVPNAPRMDLLAMNALSKGLKIVGARTPNERKLYGLSLTGDLLSNSIFLQFCRNRQKGKCARKRRGPWSGRGTGRRSVA